MATAKQCKVQGGRYPYFKLISMSNQMKDLTTKTQTKINDIWKCHKQQQHQQQQQIFMVTYVRRVCDVMEMLTRGLIIYSDQMITRV